LSVSEQLTFGGGQESRNRFFSTAICGKIWPSK